MSLTNALCAAQGAMPAAVGARQAAAQYLKVSSPHGIGFFMCSEQDPARFFVRVAMAQPKDANLSI